METMTAHSGAASTTRQKTVGPIAFKPIGQILSEYPGSGLDSMISRDLAFVWELVGGSGHGHVPRDSKLRIEYLTQVRKHLQKTYRLSSNDFRGLIAVYQKLETGPLDASMLLRAHLVGK